MPRLQKVLVATDLSEASRTSLGYAAALSQRLDASLTALYVSPRDASYQPIPTFPSEAALDPARVGGTARRREQAEHQGDATREPHAALSVPNRRFGHK